MITTPTVSGKPGQAPTGLSCDLYPLIGSHGTWTDPRGPVSPPDDLHVNSRHTRAGSASQGRTPGACVAGGAQSAVALIK